MHDLVKEGFALDAILANWDVVGMSKDNILVSESGIPYRADNGGALAYRAQGKPKGADFGPEVGEFATMRKGVFAGLTDEQVATQVQELLPKKDAILAAIPDQKTRDTLSARFDYAENWANSIGPSRPMWTRTMRGPIA